MRYFNADGSVMRFVRPVTPHQDSPGPIAPRISLWEPTARWVAPCAADKALARATVAAADARIAATLSAAQVARNLADYKAREAADAIPEPRDWSRIIGTVMCVPLPLMLLIWMLLRI